MAIVGYQETKNYPKGISSSIPPPGFTSRAIAATTTTRLNSLFNLMTSGEDAQFKSRISKLHRRQLLAMTSLLTSNSDYFTPIVGDKNGSTRVKMLFGKSDDVDALLCAAILRRFFKIMTDKYASYVAVRAMVVFDSKKRNAMYELTLHHALDLARDKQGCIALNKIITDLDDVYYKKQLLDLVARNALCLSNDASGHFVVQQVLELNDLRYTYKVAANLYGHCVDLSSKKYGNYIIQKLFEALEESMVVVVDELLRCEGDRLMRLSRSEFGSFVVCKALRVTKEKARVDLFLGLVDKLMPFLELLRRSYGSNVAKILESTMSRGSSRAQLLGVNK